MVGGKIFPSIFMSIVSWISSGSVEGMALEVLEASSDASANRPPEVDDAAANVAVVWSFCLGRMAETQAAREMSATAKTVERMIGISEDLSFYLRSAAS